MPLPVPGKSLVVLLTLFYFLSANASRATESINVFEWFAGTGINYGYFMGKYHCDSVRPGKKDTISLLLSEDDFPVAEQYIEESDPARVVFGKSHSKSYNGLRSDYLGGALSISARIIGKELVSYTEIDLSKGFAQALNLDVSKVPDAQVDQKEVYVPHMNLRLRVDGEKLKFKVVYGFKPGGVLDKVIYFENLSVDSSMPNSIKLQCQKAE